MARTWHHDKRRYHPWKADPWPEGRTGWYFINYSSSPGWWRNATTNRPQRRQARSALLGVVRGDPADAVILWPWNRPRPYWW